MLLEQGVFKKASGPTDFLSPVLFVPKPRKPDELRMCIDFRRLNAVTKRDCHALPDFREVLQTMSGSKYFTALDLTWGFWELPVVERDQHKTSFTGPDGEVYVWTKAPMGLTHGADRWYIKAQDSSFLLALQGKCSRSASIWPQYGACIPAPYCYCVVAGMQ